MFCSKCGAELFDEAIICPKCGHAVRREARKDNNNKSEEQKDLGSAFLVSGLINGLTSLLGALWGTYVDDNIPFDYGRFGIYYYSDIDEKMNVFLDSVIPIQEILVGVSAILLILGVIFLISQKPRVKKKTATLFCRILLVPAL